MSRETANAARFAKGLCVLTDLESELLEALEGAATMLRTTIYTDGAMAYQIDEVIELAHGNP